MEELNLKDLFTIAYRKKIIITLIIIISVVIGSIYSYKYKTEAYKSSATIILGKVSSTVSENSKWNNEITISESDLNLNSSLIVTYSELVRSRTVMEEVSKRLHSRVSVDSLMSSVSVSRVNTSDLLKVTATNVNPTLARDIVNEVVDVFAQYVTEIYKIDNVYIIDNPTISTSPYNVNHTKDIAISLGIGAFIVCLYVYVYAFLDNTIKGSMDIEELLNVKTLISIPFDKNKSTEELITVKDSKSVISEAFKTLRTNIQFSSFNMKGPQTLLITSCLPSEGKSYISANLAITFAQSGKKVILVDSDMRRGRQSKIFDIKNVNGLSNYISNIDSDGIEVDWAVGEYIRKTEITNLNIITAGSVPPNPAELLGSKRLIELIDSLKKYYDIIIFDGAPILPITDSLLLGRLLEKVMLVAVNNKTKKDNLLKAKSNIEDVGGKVIGVALNKVAVTNGEYGDKYYYYYSADKVNNKYDNEKIPAFILKIRDLFKNIFKKLTTFRKRLGPGKTPEEKELIEQQKLEKIKQKEAEKRIKIVEKEEKARQAEKQAQEKAEEKAKKEAELAKMREAENKKREKEKKKLEEEQAKRAKIEAEERAKEDAIMAEEKARKEKEEAIRKEKEQAIKLEMKKKKEEEAAKKRKENLKKKAKRQKEFNKKMNIFKGKLLSKKDEISEEIKIKKEEYSKKYNEYKAIKAEENKEKLEIKAKNDAEIAKIREQERKRRAKERKIQQAEKAQRDAEIAKIREEEKMKREEERKIQLKEKAKKDAELAKIREEERIKREEEKKVQQEEKAKQIAILAEEKAKREEKIAREREKERIKKEAEKLKLAEEKARKEEEAKFTDEYLQENLYPKTKYNKF